MTIERKYSLPNCTLLVEGLSDPTNEPPSTEARPLLSMLVNAECRFANLEQPLTGGRDFLESLVTATSAYAQEVLSQVNHPEAHKKQLGAVELTKVNNNRHRLIVHSASREGGSDVPSNSGQPPFQIDLTTVQLFDLVEAVDQFFADSQTLPDLSLELFPVSKRYTGAANALVKQAVPATVGVSSLALAAIAFFLVPIPEVQRPKEPKPQSTSSQSGTLSTNNSGSNPSSEALANTPAITDPSQLDTLKGKLYNQLNQSWKTRSEVEKDLIYRVGVTADGAIVGYKSVNAAASDRVQQTPLPNLLQKPVAANSTAKKQPTAQFKVVFSANDKVQVSPWDANN